MTTSNHITKVAIVGAGGRSGSFMTECLLRTGKHTVIAITRSDSQSKLPSGVVSKVVDYDKQETLVEALKGQDALIITLNVFAQDLQARLIEAAGEAGVSWILPNEWGVDTDNEDLVNDVAIFKPIVATRKKIEEIGKSSYISVATGFWYEFSLAFSDGFGFDLVDRNVTFFDDGETKITVSTWPQVGRAVAALLSLPVKPEGSTNGCLNDLRNKVVYISSYTISQKDMFKSVLRVTGTKKDDWNITHEPARTRYSDAMEKVRAGDRYTYRKLMYTRVFFDDGCGNVEHKGTLNMLLNLPYEDIDEATKIAIERAKNPEFH